GCATGFALTIGAALHYPLIVGGKPIISIPPFVVIAYELTILLGALGTLVGLLLSAGLPRARRWPGYDPKLAGTCFGLQVRCPTQETSRAEAQMLAAGAQEVRRVEG
ncbi:MAG: DUF3341 domain-containing protein, partial [Deltaproteobacteria bacterium]|nr:DUF3341 domain-containing protein [Deltaproteobacteria bacterium]